MRIMQLAIENDDPDQIDAVVNPEIVTNTDNAETQQVINTEISEAEGAAEPDVEQEALIEDAAITTEVGEADVAETAMESLMAYQYALEHLIATKTYSAETLQLVQIGVERALAPLHMNLPGKALESADMSIEQQHQVTLESLKEAFHRIATSYVMGWKHVWNAVADFGSRVETKIDKYGQKLEATKKEFDDKKSGMGSGQHSSALTELWYHFSTDKGNVGKNIVSVIGDDVELSTYVLTKYPSQVIETIKKLSSAIKGKKITTMEDAKKLGAALKSFPSTIDLFDKKFITGGRKNYLSRTGLEIDAGTKRSSLDSSLDKLAELATPARVVESGSLSHTALKVAANAVNHPVVGAAKIALPDSVPFVAGDIAKVVDYGLQYVKNVRQYLKLSEDLGKAGEELESAVSALKDSADGDGAAVVKQIEQYGQNLLQAFRQPATAEVARSIKGAKYNNYLALRMIAAAT